MALHNNGCRYVFTDGFFNSTELYKCFSNDTVITESWVGSNMFCPRCGCFRIEHFENNKPVADFFCPSCGNQFELKSKDGTSIDRINDGAYSTMLDRITGMNNPDWGCGQKAGHIGLRKESERHVHRSAEGTRTHPIS